MNLPEMLSLLEEKVREASREGSEWALAKAAFEDMEDKRKSLLASIASKYKGSQSFKEECALSDQDWKNYLEGLGYVRKDYYQAQVKWEMAKLKIEVVRTAISALKEEIKNFKG